MKYSEYIKQIEIDSLWSGRRHIVWNLDRKVNILSGINGVGKSTILNKVIRGLSAGGEFPSHMLKGVRLTVEPEDARWIRYDVIRSFDRPLLNLDAVGKLNTALTDLTTELDLQIFFLQRKYLDYQVNIGNRIIASLQSGEADAALQAQQISAPKTTFQNLIDDLFSQTGKKIVRTENEIRFSQIGETLTPYQLSSGEKQMLVILLTVLVDASVFLYRIYCSAETAERAVCDLDRLSDFKIDFRLDRIVHILVLIAKNQLCLIISDRHRYSFGH